MIGPTLLHQPAAYLPGTNSPRLKGDHGQPFFMCLLQGPPENMEALFHHHGRREDLLEATDPKSTLSTVSSINYHRRGSCTGGLGTVLGLSTSRKVPLRTFLHGSVDSPLDRSTTPDPMTLTESSACSAITTWRECLSSFSSSDYSNL